MNPKNDRIIELISHRKLESSIKASLKIMKCIAPNLNFQNAKREIGCLVLILQLIKQKNSTLIILRESHQKQPQKKCSPSDPSLFKPSGQIQVVRPEKPKRSKTSFNPNISLNSEPKG